MTAMSPAQIHSEARAFAIWRVGHLIDWDCTSVELAEQTGIDEKTVRDICRRRGWPIGRDQYGDPKFGRGQPDAVELMRVS